MINIVLISTTDPSNKVEKSLTGLLSLDCLLKDETDLMNPSVLIETGASIGNANYARIRFASGTFRHYFITSIESIKNRVYKINLKEDVLMTFAAQIKALKCTVARQENVRNGYLVDPEYNALCYKAYVTKAFPNAITNDSLYLITTG